MKGFELPTGVQDYLPDEAYFKNRTENAICDIFYRNGYERVETPVLEYLPLFSGAVGKVDVDKMLKMSDTDGSILVMRPDITLPLARMVATKIKPVSPLRLFYTGNSYNLKTDNYRYREFTQAGIEFFGEKSYLADAEVITLAIEALLAVGLKDFLIELGHAGFMSGILDEYDIVGADAEELRKLSESKNSLGMAMFLEQRKLDAAQNALMKLPSLYGKENVLEEAKKLCANRKCADAIADLEKIMSALRQRGLDKYIDIDLGNVPSLNYYTGIIFKGITKTFGAPILAGGRYDTLCDNFDYSLPATGFGLGVKNVMLALENAGVSVSRRPCDVCIRVTESADSSGIEEKLLEQGLRIDRYFGDDPLGYAASKKIGRVIEVTSEGIRELFPEK